MHFANLLYSLFIKKYMDKIELTVYNLTIVFYLLFRNFVYFPVI